MKSQQARITRRRVLMGLGGIALGLPWLERTHGLAQAQAATTAPKRIIVVTYEMGVPLGAWRPSAAGANFTLPYVTAPLEAFKDRCLFVSAIDNQVLDAGGDMFIYGHPAKKEAALTGTLTTGAFPASNSNQLSDIRSDRTTDGGANGPSIEQVVGAALRRNHAFTSVDLGVDGEAVRLGNGPPASKNSAFFFESAGNAVSLRLRPDQAFESLFAGISTGDQEPSAEDLALRRIRARNKSVLDAVRDSFKELEQGLGREDKRRLQEHAARIRQLELDTQVGQSCRVPEGIPTGEAFGNLRMDQLAPLQTRILTHAMACDLAPVGRLEFTGQQSPRFGLAALDDALDSAGSSYDWHSMVHGDPYPGTQNYLRPGRGADTEYDERLLAGYRFYVEQFAALLAELDSIPEGPETSVLDNSLVMLASDLGEGLGHAHMKMGYILAGNLGGAKRGYHLDAGPARAFTVGGEYFYAPSRYSVSQLLNSVLDMASVVDDAGRPASIGLRGYLEEAGADRRIEELFVA